MRTISLYMLALFSLSALAMGWSTPVLDRLASPEFEGRGVGTQGLIRARDLLAEELRQAGISPAISAPAGLTYLQSFRVFVGNELGPANYFAGAAPEAFMPLAFSKSGAVAQAELVFVGFGISVRGDTELQYDDYAGLDVKGKVVVAMLGDPGTGNRESAFRNPARYHYQSPMYKVQNAEMHGAAGIVLVRDPLSLGNAAEPELRFQARQGGGATSSILAGQASIRFVDALIGRSLLDIQSEIARTQRPASFALGARADFGVDLRRQLGDVDNVVGIIPGTDPALAGEYIVIGAHYDHLGYGGDSSMDPHGTGQIHAGADDNASGTQAVLNLARRIRDAGGGRRPVVIAFFTAEEVGLLGSRHFTESLPLPQGARAVAMLNLDMVGRLSRNRLTTLAFRSGAEFEAVLDRVNAAGFGFDLAKGDSGFGSSDHASFLGIKVPSIFFTTGTHEDYHRPSDTAEKINREGLAIVENFVHAVWREIDGATQPPTYDPKSEEGNVPPRGERGYGAYFGSVPEFDQGETQGVLLKDVRAGSPAEEVGLRGGDILTGLGEIQIKSLYDFVFALRFYRPNEEVEVRWVRAGEARVGRVKLRNRDVPSH